MMTEIQQQQLEEILAKAKTEYRAANLIAREQAWQRGDRALFRALRDCNLFHGTEDIDALTDLIFSPQGREFIVKYGVPKLETWQMLQTMSRSLRLKADHGIYIDSPLVRLTDRPRLWLVGSTKAEIRCTRTETYLICLAHGARALVKAAPTAVIVSECDAQSHILIQRTD